MDMTEDEYKDPTTTLAHISFDPSRPVRPVPRTGPTGLRKTERLHTQPQVYNSTKP